MTRRPAGAGRPLTPTLPGVNTLVTISAEGWAERLSRVEDADGLRLAVAAPRAGVGELEPPADGAAFEVRWPGARGMLVLPVRLVERVRGELAVWWLEATGPVRTLQRRQFVRAAVVGWPVRVGLTWMLPEETTATGDLVDLSEGGLRVRMRDVGSDAVVPAFAAVAVRLSFAEGTGAGGEAGGTGAVEVTEYELMGTVLRELPVAGPPSVRAGGTVGERSGAVDVVVQLHDAGRDGDALRARVFAWQRQARGDV